MTVSWLLRPAAASTGRWRSICFACEHSFRAEQIPAYLKRGLFQPNGRVPLCDKFVGHSKTTHNILLGWLLQPAKGCHPNLSPCHPSPNLYVTLIATYSPINPGLHCFTDVVHKKNRDIQRWAPITFFSPHLHSNQLVSLTACSYHNIISC